MATINITLDLPSRDAQWLLGLDKGTELVIVKERGDNSGLVPQAVIVEASAWAGDIHD